MLWVGIIMGEPPLEKAVYIRTTPDKKLTVRVALKTKAITMVCMSFC